MYQAGDVRALLPILLLGCDEPEPPSAELLWHDTQAAVVLRGDQQGELAGWSVAGVGDVNGDGAADLAVGAFYADEHDRLAHGSAEDIAPGAAFVFHGPLQRDHSLGQADAIMVGVEAYDTTARSLAGAGDVDGDGIDDLLIGAMHVDTVGEDGGAAYLIRGPIDGHRSLSEADVILLGDAPYAHVGVVVDGGGDLDGDGLADVLVAAHLASGEGYSGEIYALYGPLGSEPGVAELEALSGGMVRSEAKDAFGRALALAGDLDGDGLDDAAVAAPLDSTRGAFGGQAWVIPGPVLGAHAISEVAVARLVGAAGVSAGCWLADAGDTNGDGYGDLLVGAYKDGSAGTDAGAAYLLAGPVSHQGHIEAAGVAISGSTSDDKLGFRLDGLGDVDGDGRDDIVLGAPGSSLGAPLGGAAYIVYGPVEGSGAVDAVAARILLGTESGAMMGSAAGVGDLDGDGHPDVAVGAPYAGGLAGAVYLFAGVAP